MKKKGFTLIELLAVIVILAVIALIATPIILGVVEDSKKSAAVSSAYGYVEAVEKEYMLNIVKENNIIYLTDEEVSILDTPISDIKVQGNKPSKGFITLNDDGTMRFGSFCIDKYKVVYDGKTAKVVKGTCANVIAGEVVLTGDPISDIAKNLVYSGNSCKTDGTTYNYLEGCYIKGNPTNNYVWYSGFLWRIMGINADGTIRLITEENVSGLIYGIVGSAQNYDDSHANRWLNSYFLSNLKGTNIIEEQTWCSEWNGEAVPTRTTCTKNLSTAKTKVGLISLDEYNLATGKTSYLNILQAFYTLTPFDVNTIRGIDETGEISNGTAESSGYSMRPVINVKGETIVTAGNGTLSNSWTKDEAPYILNEKKISTKNTNKILNNVITSGEYVKLDGKIYRVVSKDSRGVKLVYDGYYPTQLAVGSPAFLPYMDSNVYEWIASNQETKDKIITSDWNRGATMWYGSDYRESCMGETYPFLNIKVGMMRIGEMLSGQSQSVPVKQSYWTLTYGLYGRVWASNIQGKITPPSTYNASSGIYTALYVRPAIIVKNGLNIATGNGTPSNPYEI